MPDQQFASAIETLIGGTADRVLVAAGAGQPVGQLTAAQLRTLCSIYSTAEVDSAVGAKVSKSGDTMTGGLTVEGTVNAVNLTLGADQIFPTNGSTVSVPTSTGPLSVFTAHVGTGFCFAFSGPAVSGTSGTHEMVRLQKAFTPTSGTMVFAGMRINPTINQTGGASGITRGLWLSGTITAAADYRAIDVTTGQSCFQDIQVAGAITASGALTCGAISATGGLTLRDSGTPMFAEVTRSYTSDTNFSSLVIAANSVAGTYDICSRLGSGGGSAYPVRVGHLNSAGTFTGLTVATSGAATLNTGYMLLGNQMQVFTFNGVAWSSVAVNGGGLAIYSSFTGSGIGCAVTGAAANGTSGDHAVISVPKGFAPTSGTMVYTGLKVNPTVNQTGSASGVSRGVWINPVLTAAADWRAIEVTTGKSILQAVEAAAISSTAGISAGPVTFAVLNATTATATLGVYRITDRGNRLAYPDGTNWRFVSDDAIIS